MGLIDKVKNLFTEEVEVEEETYTKPPKREKIKEVEKVYEEPVVQQPTPKPIVEEKPAISESPVLSREERPRMPVYFDDNAFSDLKGFEEEKKEEPIKRPNRELKFNRKNKNENLYKGNNKEEPIAKKIFKPSPIISPVYGVLDKNYKKDDVKTKQSRKEPVRITPTIDDVRAKAYGSLEEDLDDTLFTGNTLDLEKKSETKTTKPKEVEKEIESVDNTDLTKELELQRQKIDEINQYIKSNSVVKKKEEPEVEMEEEGVENELFDLIDSMYEKRDEA